MCTNQQVFVEVVMSVKGFVARRELKARKKKIHESFARCFQGIGDSSVWSSRSIIKES